MTRLYDQLVSVLHLNSYRDITFYLSNVPIVSVHLHRDGNIYILTNNMDEMNCYQLTYSSSEELEELKENIESILIGNNIEELLIKSNEVTFKSLLLEGVIDSHKVQIEQAEVYYDDKTNEDKTTWVTYTFPNSSVSIFIIAEIISAFIHQFFS